MGKYTNITDDIFSIFITPTWASENIKTIPSNFITPNLGNEYIRISIIVNALSKNSGTGIIIADIFTPAGQGPKRTSEIADKLDAYFANKSLSTIQGNVTQCFDSSLNSGKRDADNSGLFRTTYNLNFKFYGVN